MSTENGTKAALAGWVEGPVREMVRLEAEERETTPSRVVRTAVREHYGLPTSD